MSFAWNEIGAAMLTLQHAPIHADGNACSLKTHARSLFSPPQELVGVGTEPPGISIMAAHLPGEPNDEQGRISCSFVGSFALNVECSAG